MNTRRIFQGTPSVNDVIRVPAPEGGLLMVVGTSFTATLQHLKTCINTKITEIDDAVDADFSDLLPTITYDATQNYDQLLGQGNYAIKFSAVGASVEITVTS